MCGIIFALYFPRNVRFDTYRLDTYESVRIFRCTDMRFINESSPLPGPSKLLSHIRALGKSIPDWCEAESLPRHTVEKAIKGKLTMSVPLALEIQRATNGAVQVSDWDFDARHATGTED